MYIILTLSPLWLGFPLYNVIAPSSNYRMVVHQMDVKATFLNKELEEKIYMDQPKGCIVPGEKKKVCKLAKALYRLK